MDTGKPHTTGEGRTYVEVTASCVGRLLEEDERLFVLGMVAAPGQRPTGCLELLQQRFATRVRQVPFCERGLLGLCFGAAMAGAKPIIDLIPADNLLYAVGDLAHYLAGLPYAMARSIRSGLVVRMAIGATLASGPFQSGNYHAAFAQFESLHVVAPMSAAETCGLLASAVRQDTPVLLLEHKQLFGLTEEGTAEADELPLDGAIVLRRGQHLTLVAYGYMTRVVLEAAAQLAHHGYEAEVIHLRSLVPYDRETLVQSVARTGRILLVDDGWPNCSVLSQVAADVTTHAFHYLDAPPLRLHGASLPTPYSPALEPRWRPTVDRIVEAAQQLLAL